MKPFDISFRNGMSQNVCIFSAPLAQRRMHIFSLYRQERCVVPTRTDGYSKQMVSAENENRTIGFSSSSML